MSIFKSKFPHVFKLWFKFIKFLKVLKFLKFLKFTSVPKIDAIRKSFSSSFPDHFPFHFDIKFVDFSNILLPDTDLVLTLYILDQNEGKGQSVRMVRWPSLTFQKHMAYHIWKFIASNPVLYCIIQSLSFHVAQLMEISNLTFSQKGQVREYYSCGLEYCLSPLLRSNP